jgi:hypothetical protein
LTADLAWNFMKFCKMGIYAIIGDTPDVSLQVAKDCKGNPANYSVLKYILEFRTASALALVHTIF